MCEGFDDDNASKPSMEKVKSIERNPEDLNEGIVPSRKKKEWHHVDNDQMPSSAS